MRLFQVILANLNFYLFKITIKMDLKVVNLDGVLCVENLLYIIVGQIKSLFALLNAKTKASMNFVILN